MSVLDTSLKRFKYLLKENGVKQVTLADASEMTSGGISDMLKKHLSWKAAVGLKKLKPNINLDWVASGNGGPYLDTTGAYLDGFIDQTKLILKIGELEDRLTKLENAKNDKAKKK